MAKRPNLIVQEPDPLHHKVEQIHDLAEQRGTVKGMLWHALTENAFEGIESLLSLIGEDGDRAGLQETPARVVKAFLEMTTGYEQDPRDILKTSFDLKDVDDEYAGKGYQGAVTLRDIEFVSLCEHHMLPFVGKAHVSYIPGEEGYVVGISKLARVVDAFAKRLQVQERMTQQIANAVYKVLGAQAVAVRVEAEHMCMRVRGASKQEAFMVTTSLLGSFKEDARARSEVMAVLEVPRP